MAAIDHTILCFHNGKLVTDDDYDCDYTNSIPPFDYDRDARLNVESINLPLQEKRTLYDLLSLDTDKQDWAEKNFEYIDKEIVRVYSNKKDTLGLNEKLIITYEAKHFNVIYYLDGNESYVLLGGYGHFVNPYTHFYDRGYGDNFDRIVATDCYEWLMETVLKYDVIDHILSYSIRDEDKIRRNIQKRCNYTAYWDMTPEERENYSKENLIDIE